MRRLPLAGLALVVSLAVVAVASAKTFEPGDIRLCGATRCVAVTDRAALHSFSTFIYHEGRPPVAATPIRGTRFFELKYRNGYVAGDVGSRALDRFRSHGVLCGRFRTGIWYRMPPTAVAAVRALTRDVAPLRLSGTIPRSC
jgi:hypothetical protein